MALQRNFDFSIGLSEDEKRDLEKMIGDFQKKRDSQINEHDFESIQRQIDMMNKRLAFLTSMFLAIDRRMKPLYETICLTFEKSEVLNQRINTIIDAIRSGEPL
jgi:hypothetical protein